MSRRRSSSSFALFALVAFATALSLLKGTMHYITKPSAKRVDVASSPTLLKVEDRLTVPPMQHIGTTVRPASCSPVSFKYSHDVFSDDECYPAVFKSVPKEPVVISHRASTNRLESIVTQAWNLKPDYSYFDKLSPEPASLKRFDDAIVYRTQETTFFINDKVWSASERCRFTKTEPVSLASDLRAMAQIDAAVLLSSQSWGGGHFHYMAEKALTIGPARHLLEMVPDSKVIVEDAHPRLLEFFELLGIDRSRVVLFGDGNVAKVRRLYLPYYSQCGFVNSEMLALTRRWLHDRQPELYTARKEPPRDILVIDRRDSSGNCLSRCLHNTAAIMAALQQAYPDRKVVRFAGNFGMKEQMEFFANSELVVAPHGAGLVNMFFLPLNGKVVEIWNHPTEINYCFHNLSAGLRLLYRGISPKRTSPTTVDFSNADPDRVLLAARELLDTAEPPKLMV